MAPAANNHRQSEKRPLLSGAKEAAAASPEKERPAPAHRATPLRWYMLFLGSMLCLLQGMIWNTYGPISTAIQPLTHWGSGTISMLANWGCICYLVAFMPTAYLLSKGIRTACLVTAALLVLSCSLRVITVHLPAVTWLTHAGQIFNGLAGPVAMSLGPSLSAAWFPVNQRVTATAIVGVANYIGLSLSFVLGPLMVPERTGQHAGDLKGIKHDLLNYIWLEFGASVAIFLLVIVHFPNKPKHVPTATANEKRTDFWKGVRQLFRIPTFWILGLAYGSITGVFSGWLAFLLNNLDNFLSDERAQDESGWLGFYSTIAGCIAGVLASKLADVLKGRMKIIIIVFCFLSTLLTLWFALMVIGVVSRKTVFMYLSVVPAGMLINGTVPLFYEAAVEVTYPVDEGTTTSVLTMIMNVGCLIFLVVPEIPNVGSLWVNWMLMGSCALALIVMFFFKEDYRRLSHDLGRAYTLPQSTPINAAS